METINAEKSNNMPITGVDGRKKIPYKNNWFPISNSLTFWKKDFNLKNIIN